MLKARVLRWMFADRSSLALSFVCCILTCRGVDITPLPRRAPCLADAIGNGASLCCKTPCSNTTRQSRARVLPETPLVDFLTGLSTVTRVSVSTVTRVVCLFPSHCLVRRFPQSMSRASVFPLHVSLLAHSSSWIHQHRQHHGTPLCLPSFHVSIWLASPT